MSRPWCNGGRRAVPGLSPYDADRDTNCPVCGIRLRTRAALVPNHRERRCLVAGCEKPQTGGGLCVEHNREIVGVDG